MASNGSKSSLFEAVASSFEETGLSPFLTRLRYLFLPSFALSSPNQTISL